LINSGDGEKDGSEVTERALQGKNESEQEVKEGGAEVEDGGRLRRAARLREPERETAAVSSYARFKEEERIRAFRGFTCTQHTDRGHLRARQKHRCTTEVPTLSFI